MVPRHWIVLTALAGVAGCAQSRALRTADQTAEQYVRAIRAADSAALTALSARGVPHNSLCVSRWGADDYWPPGTPTPQPRRGRQWADSVEYAVRAAPLQLVHSSARDTSRHFEFVIGLQQPTKVARYTQLWFDEPARSRGWWACIQR